MARCVEGLRVASFGNGNLKELMSAETAGVVAPERESVNGFAEKQNMVPFITSAVWKKVFAYHEYSCAGKGALRAALVP